MKKLIFAIAMVVSVSANAQTVIHTDSSLNAVDKGELVKIYIAQVNQLVEKLPYSVWGYADDLQGIDIPKKSKYIGRKMKSMATITEMYTDDNSEYMPEIIHYADKRRLVQTILYLQDINTKIIRVE
jgi:hypothetical protein